MSEAAADGRCCASTTMTELSRKMIVAFAFSICDDVAIATMIPGLTDFNVKKLSGGIVCADDARRASERPRIAHNPVECACDLLYIVSPSKDAHCPAATIRRRVFTSKE
jgi:hypothetical protein